MKILIPITAFDRAGGSRVLSELASHWSDAGHEVNFLVDIRSKPPYFPTRAKIIRFDKFGKITRTDQQASLSLDGGKLASVWVRMWLALSRIGSDYDVILANHSLTTYPIAFARTGSARKWYYIQAYEPEYYGFIKGFRGGVLEVLAAFSYRFRFHQVANAPIYIGYKGIRANQWVPPGIDFKLFRLRELPPVFDENRTIIIGTIGRKELTKGTADVLAAFEMLAARNSRISLSVAFGNLPKNWHHPRANIIMPNGDAELAAWYRSIDILIAPGTVQLGACHYPVLEAMASGTPVITTGYLPAHTDNSWIVPIHSPKAIVDAVQDIIFLDTQKLNEKVALATVAVARFNWKCVANDFLKLFSELPKCQN